MLDHFLELIAASEEHLSANDAKMTQMPFSGNNAILDVSTNKQTIPNTLDTVTNPLHQH